MRFTHWNAGGIALAVLVGCLHAAPAVAQVETQPPLDDTQAAVDPLFEIRYHFRTVLPTTWWVEEPEPIAGGYRVVVHFPDGWRGNPTGKAMTMCPERDARLWRVSKILEIQPQYDRRRWPPFECRK